MNLGVAGQATARADSRLDSAAQERLLASRSARVEDRNPMDPPKRLSVLSGLDFGFSLLEFRFKTLLGLSAAFFLPIQVLEAVFRLGLNSTSELPNSVIGPSVLALGGSSAASVLILGLRTIALSLLGICVGHLVMSLANGHQSSFSELLKVAAKRSWVAALIVGFSLLIRAPMACLPVVGFLIADALLFIASIAAGAERLGPLAAIMRSVRLTRSAFAVTLLFVLGSLAMTQILRLSLSIGPLSLLALFTPPENWMVIAGQISALVLLLVEPLSACLAAGGYVMLRSRSEGFDIELRLRRGQLSALSQQRGSNAR